MRTFVFEPLQGIRGSVQFGMSRNEARALLSPVPPEPFSRGGPVDGFYDASLQLSYDESDKVEFIEFARDENHRVLLDDLDLFTVRAMSVVEFLKQAYYLTDGDGHSFRFPDIELGLWKPLLPRDDSEEGLFFESAGFGRSGYFSATNAKL